MPTEKANKNMFLASQENVSKKNHEKKTLLETSKYQNNDYEKIFLSSKIIHVNSYRNQSQNFKLKVSLNRFLSIYLY